MGDVKAEHDAMMVRLATAAMPVGQAMAVLAAAIFSMEQAWEAEDGPADLCEEDFTDAFGDLARVMGYLSSSVDRLLAQFPEARDAAKVMPPT